ncbi:MAG: methylated-DNA--[protein]-cysteine S-methyltransferase [Phycisphaerae bacterium]
MRERLPKKEGLLNLRTASGNIKTPPRRSHAVLRMRRASTEPNADWNIEERLRTSYCDFHCGYIATASGLCGLVWTNTARYPQRLLRFYPACRNRRLLGRIIRDEYPTAKMFAKALPIWLGPLQRFLIAYYSDAIKPAAWVPLPWPWLVAHLHWDGQTEFGRKVLVATFKIKTGTTISYGELARRIGQPRAARAVGGALARNPWPVIIPCHRVIGSDGAMTGFSGYGAVAAKRWMLEMERLRRT